MTLPGPSRHWLEAKHLLRWLLIATKGLSDESRARVNEEITGHFHDALDEGIAAGLEEELAAERAVQSLGSPRAARRAFRRTYLTRNQARMVRDLVAPPRKMWFLRVYLVLASAGLAAFELRRPTTPDLYPRWAVVAVMAVAVIILATAVPRLYRRGQQRAAVALAALSDGSLWLGWGFMVTGPNGGLWALAVFAILAIFYLPLLPKFDKHREAT